MKEPRAGNFFLLPRSENSELSLESWVGLLGGWESVLPVYILVRLVGLLSW